MIPSSDVNSLEGARRVTVEWVSWCIWTLIYMSTNRRGGSSHLLVTLKTLISYISKVETDKCSKRSETGGERKKTVTANRGSRVSKRAAGTEANTQKRIKREEEKGDKKETTTTIWEIHNAPLPFLSDTASKWQHAPNAAASNIISHEDQSVIQSLMWSPVTSQLLEAQRAVYTQLN